MQLIRAFGPALPQVLPFFAFIALMAASGMLADSGRLNQSVDVRWFYALRTIVVAALVTLCWRSYRELHKPYNIYSSNLMLSIGAGLLVFALWIHLDIDWLTFGVSDGFIPLDSDGVLLWKYAMPRLVGAAILVPIIEELFWRSFLMRWLENQQFLSVDPKSVSPYALLVSSVVFALEHQLWFAGLIAGLVYGWLYIRTANLWYPIIAHATTNAVLGLWVIHTGNWHFW